MGSGICLLFLILTTHIKIKNITNVDVLSVKVTGDVIAEAEEEHLAWESMYRCPWNFVLW